MLGIAIPVFMLAITAVLAWQGTVRARACSACGYDMSRVTSLVCPECGHAHPTPAHVRFRKRRGWALWLCGTVAAGVVASGLIAGYHWTTFVPRVLLASVLEARVATPPGAPLPVPNRSYMYSGDAWERLVWQEQVARAIDAWSAMVIAPRRGATMAEIKALLPAARQIEALFDQTGGTNASESWPVGRAVRRLQHAAEKARAAAAPAAPGEVAFDRGQWALSELQYEGADYTHRPDWASTPADLLLAMLCSGDPELEQFAVSRIGRYQERLKEVMDAVRRVAASSTNPTVRSQAEDLIVWMSAFGPDGVRTQDASPANTPRPAPSGRKEPEGD